MSRSIHLAGVQQQKIKKEKGDTRSFFTPLRMKKPITTLRILYPIWTVVSIFSLLYAPTLASDTMLFKLGQLGQIVVQLFQIAVALLLYKLFEKTDKTQAFMLALLGILGVPFALMAIILPEASHLAAVFWGLWLIPMGTLVIRSKMFPKFIGHFLYGGALGYLAGTTAYFLIGYVPNYIEVFTFGELIWVLWITFVGVRK